MLPSMRYQTKKLAELYHQKKSYKDHRKSVSKIMNKTPQTSADRTRELNSLRNKMHSAFNHTQYVRAKQINKDNHKIYKKCHQEHHRVPQRHLLASTPRNHAYSINNVENDDNQAQRNLTPRSSRQILLKNHRKQSINKMTGYDRTKQNFRLAVKITQPCPTINTRKLEQIHEEAKRRKQRIMKYQSSSLKSQKYLQKKFSSVSSLRSQVSNSPLPQKKSDIATSSARNTWRKSYGGLSNFVNRNNSNSLNRNMMNQTSMGTYNNHKKSIFRGKINQSFNLSITDQKI